MPTVEASFCFPVRRCENSRLAVVPFDFALHAQWFVQGTKEHPDLFTYVAQGPFSTVSDFSSWYEPRIKSSMAENLFAILIKDPNIGEQQAFAGIIGLQNANPLNATIEIGFVTVLPAFQRTFVTSNAIGLLLLYALDQPPNGLGLRRCQWQSHASNEQSKRVALRMHFTFEGIQRFQRTVPTNKIGNGFDVSHLADPAGLMLGPSRDSAVFAHYCDEWPLKREKVIAIMDRR